MREPARRAALLVTLVALWAVSLAAPALRVAGGPMLRGIDVLLQGWQAASHGLVAWYANPLLAAALLLAALGRIAGAAVLSGLALLLALSSFAIGPILALQMAHVPAVTLLPGFYAWLAAIIALLAWSTARAVRRNPKKRQIRDSESPFRD